MDIRIGIANSPREINFETAQTAGEVEQTVIAALDAKSSCISLTDDKGKVYLVPTVSLAYIEIGSDVSRRVGFVS